MPYNGSGTFLRVRNWMQDAAANIRIRADRHDSEDDNFAQGLSQCITKDGQTTITANLPMANYRHTNVGAAQAINQYARYDQVQLGKAVWAVAGGTADALTATYSPNTISPVDGQLYYARATAANATTTPTFSPDGETAQVITKYGAEALAVGDISGAGHELILRYRLADTKYELLNPAPTISGSANNTFSGSNTFSGKILTPDDGELTIASGVITVTGVYHTVDTEGDAATDDLVTINGGADGQILTLRIEDDARDVVLKSTGNIDLVSDVALSSIDSPIELIYDGGASKWLQRSATAAQGAKADAAIPFVMAKSALLSGLVTSNNSTDATNDIDIAAGSAISDDGTTVMTLAAGITKRLDAAWAVGSGAGGLDTGAIADGHYFVWLIHRTDTGVTDVLFSVSGTAPTMPENYTKKKRIGSFMRISAAIRPFYQKGNIFYFRTPVQDYNASIGASETLITLSVPQGEKIEAQIMADAARAGSLSVKIIDADQSIDDAAFWVYSATNPSRSVNAGYTLTSAAGQIKAQCAASTSVIVSTLSYIDRGIYGCL